MSMFKKRMATVVMGLAIAFGVVACDDVDNGTTTTNVPGSTDTTDPVGS